MNCQLLLIRCTRLTKILWAIYFEMDELTKSFDFYRPPK